MGRYDEFNGVGNALGSLGDYFIKRAEAKDEKKRVTSRSTPYEESANEGPPALYEDKYNSEGERIGRDVVSGAGAADFADRRKAGILGAEDANAKEKSKALAEDQKQKREDFRFRAKLALEKRRVKTQERKAEAAEKKADRPLLSAKPGRESAKAKPNPFEAQKLYQKTVEEAKRAGVPADEYARSVGVDLAELQTWIHPDGFGGGGSSIRGGARKPNKDPLNLAN